MNGRIYDPVIGRFMSADPNIQSPGNLQSYNRYSYGWNNPLLYTDPSGYANFISDFFHGLSDAWHDIWRSDVGRVVVGAAIGWATGGLVSDWVTNSIWASSNACTVAGITAGNIAGAAAGGFAGGLVASNGDVGFALKSGIGFAIGGSFGGDVFGQMIGSGINGYLQTGTGKGFARGFAAGAIPQDLGIDAYWQSPAANIGIGVARDGVRGSIISGSIKGFGNGVLYGQINNAIGHLVGLSTTGALPKFNGGSFFYEGTFWTDPATGGSGAITFGNVISGPPDLSQYPDSFLYRHERGHIPQSNVLGALYIPAHAISLTAAELFGGGHHSRINVLENYLHQVPHDGGASAPYLDWLYGTRFK